MIVTGHTLNFLPGVSVIEKVRAADAVIWMDDFQYVRHGFVNRNRLTVDGPWLTVPVHEHDTFKPMKRVRIADPTFRARRKIARTLEMTLGEAAAGLAAEVMKPFDLLVGLNHQLLLLLLDELGVTTRPYFQTFLASGAGISVDPILSDDELALVPGRERLAAMVKEIGGTVWLSGPSGDRYLNEEPFHKRGIEVRYFPAIGPNPSAATLLRDRRRTELLAA